ncbi:MAG: MarR family transcriptional regulator [Candidatus Puniceispirillum sp.]|nr:MarR family transcriptional regulator [Candidatus Puniceispirillum sp.]MBL6774172.1 MarR family transcriptional regulator [Candidatus Puniceispirillum sp.]
MADVKPIGKALFLREEELRRGIELMFFAYRDFTGEADSILAEQNMGRAHHRAIYFIGRNPGITVSDLLTILCITKQSLSRVLSGLMNDGYVTQKQGPSDRRQRLLYLTGTGTALEARLTSVQGRRVAAAYREAGVDAVDGFQRVLRGLLDNDTIAQIAQQDRSTNV